MVSQNTKIRLLPDSSAPLTIKLLYQLLSKCKRGRLHITVDAETYLVEGKQPGPDANITIHKSLKIIKKLIEITIKIKKEFQKKITGKN